MLTTYKRKATPLKASPLAPKFSLENYYSNSHSCHEHLGAEISDGVAFRDTKAKQLSAWLLGETAQSGKCLQSKQEDQGSIPRAHIKESGWEHLQS